MANPFEARKSVRVKCSLYLRYGKFESGALVGEEFDGFTQDLSIGGVLFASSLPYHIDETLRLLITFPGWQKFKPAGRNPDIESEPDTVQFLGTVRRVEKLSQELYVVGINFTDVNDDMRQALTGFIKQYQR